jgi:hypothetical protein
MIDPLTIEAYNSRQTVDLNSIKKMKPAELDRVKTHGSNAENLLKNKDLALFIHQYKFELCDILTELTQHRPEDDAMRVAIANQIRGIDGFITTLKRAVYFKNKVVTQQQSAAEPNL